MERRRDVASTRALAAAPTDSALATRAPGSGALLRPGPVAGLAVGGTDTRQRVGTSAETALGPLRRAHGRLALPRERPGTGAAGTSGLVVRRTLADYTAAFDAAFEKKFWEGFRDGLDELVERKIIKQSTVGHIEASHVVVIQHRPGWDADFDVSLRARDHREDGMVAGGGAGFDQGYDEAITEYGYKREYSAMDPGDRATALLDNGGICVYCNVAPCADVDHIEPLKVHWERFAHIDKLTRSAHANDPKNLVGTCANCNRSKGSRRLKVGWNPPSPAWAGAGTWWPHGPARVVAANSPPPYW